MSPPAEPGRTFTEFLMGIGSGGEAASSGEKIALTLAIAEHSDGSHGNRHATSSICIFDVGANVGQFSGIAKAVLKGHPYNIALGCYRIVLAGLLLLF